ncbi:unnamed protein product [Rhodiola kirilowii]
MQRQQQYQSLAGTRQHSAISKNIEGVQFSPVINGTPFHDTSSMFSNWGQHGGSPSLQGMPQLASAHDHISASDTKVNQQYDKSSYDSSMANAGCNLNGIYLQGIPSQHGPLFNKISGNQIQQQNAQSSGFTRSFLGEQNLDSSNQAFVSLLDCSKSNVYGHVHQIVSNENTFGNFEQASISPKNATAYEINGNGQGCCLSNHQDNKLMYMNPTPGYPTLDPLEEKLLFNMDDNLWDISAGKCTGLGTGNPGNVHGHSNASLKIPSIQCGSWSALMQSTLAETSSGDTGMQDEWRGLNFQNMDLSADNRASNFVESGHQQAEYVENSLQPASTLTATEVQYLNSSDMHFPGFHQSVMNNHYEQDRSLQPSHDYNHQISKTEGRLETYHQQLSSTLSKPQVQITSQTKNGWTVPDNGHAESNTSHPHLSSINQQINNSNFWSAQNVQSGTSSTLVGQSQNARMNSFSSGSDSQPFVVSQETQKQESSQLAYSHHTSTADALRDSVRMANQDVSSNTTQAMDGSYIQLNSNPAEERSDTSMCNTLDNSMIFQVSNMAAQRSQNVHQLFQNVNQSRVEGSMVHCNSISQGQKNASTAVSEAQSQIHNPSASQALSMPHTPPSERFPSHNLMHESQIVWQKSAAPVTLSSFSQQSQPQRQQISRSAVGSQPIQTAEYSAATGYANAIVSPRENTPPSTHSKSVARHYTDSGSLLVSHPPSVSSLSQWDGFPSKSVNQWTAVPIHKHSTGAKSEILQGSEFLKKLVERTTGSPQNRFEQETENGSSSGLSAISVIKYEDEKCIQHISYEVPDSIDQLPSERRESTENLGGRSEKNIHINQMNIMYSNLDAAFWSTNSIADMTNQCLAITRPNKRKLPTSELLPWHKEVVNISVSYPDIRMEEREWAQATNRLMKVEIEAELHKPCQSYNRPKKRILLTTRLMQKLLHPAPGTIFSKDAALAFESVVYIIARLSLGDACNMSCAREKTDLVDKNDTEGNINASLAVNNFIIRTKQLEGDLQRIDKRPLFVDIRVEYQDLERFSVINRFAIFHSRVQPNPSDPFSGRPEMYNRRYVTAQPMSKDIPSVLQIQCVSL